jgi:hypothetical protein
MGGRREGRGCGAMLMGVEIQYRACFMCNVLEGGHFKAMRDDAVVDALEINKRYTRAVVDARAFISNRV